MIIPTKTYEKPASGLYTAILADIVDLGYVTSTFNGATKSFPAVRFVWFLGTNVQTGQAAIGKDGKTQLSVSQRYNVSNLHEKSNIYKALKQILNAAPSPTLDIDTLIGTVRNLLVNTETKEGKEYANIMGVLPAAPGTTVALPADFTMDRRLPEAQQAKNRATQTTRPQVPAQQAAAPAAPLTTAATAAGIDVQALLAQVAALQAAAAKPAQGADVAF